MSDYPRDLRYDPLGVSGTSGTADDRPASLTTCPDCGGRQWRRSHGSVACACLVRDVRAQAAAHHGLVDRLTARLAEIEERLAATEVRVAELESSELLAWARREWEEWKARNA